MGLERTEAIVLRGVDFSETSRIVTFLTPERGRVACMAKGMRRPKSELASVLDLFNRVELVFHWKASRSVHALREVTLLDGYAGVKRDLWKSSQASLPLEIALRAVHEDEPSEEVFDVLKNGLETLAGFAGNAADVAVWMLYRLLAALGYEPRSDAPGFGFDLLSGVADDGARSDLRLSDGAKNDLKALAHSAALPETMQAPRELFAVLARYAEHQLATTLRSRRVIEQLIG